MVGEWQDISTAPRDGTEILAYTTLFGGRVTMAVWDSDKYAKVPKPRFISRESIYGRADLLKSPPTHWMPLPNPPEPSHD